MSELHNSEQQTTHNIKHAVKINQKSKSLIRFVPHMERRLLYLRIMRVNGWSGWIYGIIYQLKTPKLKNKEIKKEILIRQKKQIFCFQSERVKTVPL